MEQDSQFRNNEKLESQIREAYGRIVYTFTCHNKMTQRLLKKNSSIKICQIVLSALATGGFLTTLLYDKIIASYVGTIISLILLVLNMYTKDFDLVGKATEHQKTADQLWKIREEYISLLVDFEVLERTKVISKRDDLQKRTMEIYNQSPRTDSKSYKEAQKALKKDEEQTFSEKEIDNILPNSIRRLNKKQH